MTGKNGKAQVHSSVTEKSNILNQIEALTVSNKMFLSNKVEESKSFNRPNIHRIKKNPKIVSLSCKQFRLEGKTNSFPKLSRLNNLLFLNIPCMVSAWNNHVSSQVLICMKTLESKYWGTAMI